MTKWEFIEKLNSGLCGLPPEDIGERLMFYIEMIDDRIEDGLSEEAAVAELGPVEKIVEQIVAETPLVKIAKERIKPKRRLKAWEISLLICGFPIWLSLGIALLAVVFSIYASLWAVIASFWAIFATLAATFAGGVAAGAILIVNANLFAGIAIIGCGVLFAGLSIFSFFGCCAATKGAASLTGKIAVGIKNCFIKKEAA